MYPGMRIAIFPDTDVRAYIQMINGLGYHSKKYRHYIEVGEPMKATYDRLKLARTLRRARKAKMKREDIARIMGVCEESVYNWEIGRTIPRKSNLRDYCRIVGLTEEDIKECQVKQ